MTLKEQDARDLELQNELKRAFEEYLHATGTERIEAKRRYLEMLGSFSALVITTRDAAWTAINLPQSSTTCILEE